MIARSEIDLVSRSIEVEYGEPIEAPEDVFIASVDLPFTVAERTMCLDEYIEQHGVDAAKRLMDELLYAKTVYDLPLTEAIESCRHRFNGISMRCRVFYDPEKNDMLARIDVAYRC